MHQNAINQQADEIALLSASCKEKQKKILIFSRRRWQKWQYSKDEQALLFEQRSQLRVYSTIVWYETRNKKKPLTTEEKTRNFGYKTLYAYHYDPALLTGEFPC